MFTIKVYDGNEYEAYACASYKMKDNRTAKDDPVVGHVLIKIDPLLPNTAIKYVKVDQDPSNPRMIYVENAAGKTIDSLRVE